MQRGEWVHLARARWRAHSADADLRFATGGAHLLVDGAHGTQVLDVASGVTVGFLHRTEDRKTLLNPDLAGFATDVLGGGGMLRCDYPGGRPSGECRTPSDPYFGQQEPVLFSADGAVLLTSSSIDVSVARLWDWRTGEELHYPNRERGPGELIAFSPGGSHAVWFGIRSGRPGVYWDVRSGEKTELVQAGSGLGGKAAFDVTGNRLVVSLSGAGGSVVYRMTRDLANPRELLPAAADRTVRALTFLDADRVAVVDSEGRLTVVGTAAGAKPQTVSIGCDVDAAAFSAQRELLAVREGRRVRLFGLDGEPKSSAADPLLEAVHDLRFSANGMYLTALVEQGAAPHVLRWDVDRRESVLDASWDAAERGDPIALGVHGTAVVSRSRAAPVAGKTRGTFELQVRPVDGDTRLGSAQPESTYSVRGAQASYDPVHKRLWTIGTMGELSVSDIAAGSSRLLPEPESIVASANDSWTRLTRDGRASLCWKPLRAFDPSVTVQLRSTVDGAELWRGTLPQRISAVAASVTASRLWVASFDGWATLHDTGTSTRIGSWPGTGPGQGRLCRLATSPDGRWVASADEHASVTVRAASDGHAVLVAPALHAPPSMLTFSANGTRVAVGTVTGAVSVVDLPPDAQRHALALPPAAGAATRLRTTLANPGPQVRGTPLAATWSPDGKRFAILTQQREVSVFDAASGRVLHSWSLASFYGKDLEFMERGTIAFLRGGRHLAVGDAAGLIVRNASDGAEVRRLVMDAMGVVHVEANPFDDDLAFESEFVEARLVHAVTGKVRSAPELDDGRVFVLGFGMRADSLVVGTESGNIALCWKRTGRAKRVIAVDGLPVALGSDAKAEHLFCGLDSGAAQLFDLKSGDKLVGYQAALAGGRTALDVDRAAARGAWALANGGVGVLDFAEPDDARTLVFHRSLVEVLRFSPKDGRLLTVGGSGEIQVWDRELKPVFPTARTQGAVVGLSVSDDGRRVAVVDETNGVTVRSLRDATDVQQIPLLPAVPYRVRFSPRAGRVAVIANGEFTRKDGKTFPKAHLQVVDVGARKWLLHWDWKYSALRDAAFLSEAGLVVAHSTGSLTSLNVDTQAELGLRKMEGIGPALLFAPSDQPGRLQLHGSTHRVSFHTGTLEPIAATLREQFIPSDATMTLPAQHGYVMRERGGAIRYFALGGGSNALDLGGLPGVATCFAVCDRASLAAVGDDQGVVRVWAGGSSEPLLEFSARGRAVTGIGFQPDGTALVTADREGTIAVWDLTDLR